MYRSSMNAVMVGAWSLAGCALLGLTTTADAQRVVKRSLVTATSSDDDRKIEVRIDDGEVQVWINGERVPDDQIQRKDGRVIVLDENGEPLEGVSLFATDDDFAEIQDRLREWQFKFNEGDFEFADNFFENSPPVMLGLTMAEPGRALEVHLGLEPGESTMITGVYEGLPAHKAGLREYDLIVGVDGARPATPDAIREVLEELDDGDSIRLQ
ncbi:MAG: PDZ domain-containing protein, partial [Planctomycetota bacterium]